METLCGSSGRLFLFLLTVFAVCLYAVVDSSVAAADDRLADHWIDSYLNETPTSDWAAEFTNAHHQHPPNPLIPAEHLWARDFLGQHEHDIW